MIWIELNDNIPSEISQKKRDRYRIISHIWGSKVAIKLDIQRKYNGRVDPQTELSLQRLRILKGE